MPGISIFCAANECLQALGTRASEADSNLKPQSFSESVLAMHMDKILNVISNRLPKIIKRVCSIEQKIKQVEEGCEQRSDSVTVRENLLLGNGQFQV